MNIILLILLLIAIYIGLKQYRAGKVEIPEAPQQTMEPDRVSEAQKYKAAMMQGFWSHQLRKIYKELHK